MDVTTAVSSNEKLNANVVDSGMGAKLTQTEDRNDMYKQDPTL